MNYLFRYLSTLKPGQAGFVEQAPLTDRERQVVTLLLQWRHEPERTKEEALDALAMSVSMFDKSCSTALDKVLLQAAPAGGIAILKHLVYQAINDLLVHEARMLEKDHVPSLSLQEQQRFYGELFYLLHRRFGSEKVESYSVEIAEKWKALDPTNSAPLIIASTLLRTEIWTQAARRRPEIEREVFEERLLALDAEVAANGDPVVRYMHLKAWIVYYGQLKKNIERRRALLQESVELCLAHPDRLSIEERLYTECQIAEDHYFYHTEHSTPYEMYRELFTKNPELLREEHYHLYKYVQLALILGEYAEAERVMLQYFGASANMVTEEGGRSKTVAILWTKLCLLTERYDEAVQHLEDAVRLNHKTFFLQAEIECRMLHSALAFLQKDFAAIELRFPAHIKFLRSKDITYKTSQYYPWFFKLLMAFIDERTTGKKLSPKLEAKLKDYMIGAAAQYGVLLQKCRAQ